MTTTARYAIRPLREASALADIVAMVQDLVDDARALVERGVRPIEAVDQVVREATPRAVAAVACVALWRAVDPDATDSPGPRLDRTN